MTGLAGAFVPTKRPNHRGQTPPEVNEPVPAKVPAGKGKPTSTRLYELHSKQLSELAREEELDGGSAEAFDRHFGALLHNLLIAAKDARLKKLRAEAESGG